MYYHHLLLVIFQSFLSQPLLPPSIPHNIVAEADKHLQTLIRLYYLRHGYEAMDLHIVIPLILAGFDTLDEIDSLNDTNNQSKHNNNKKHPLDKAAATKKRFSRSPPPSSSRRLPFQAPQVSPISKLSSPSPNTPDLETLRSTLLLAAKGLSDQRKNHYLAEALFRVLRGRMRPAELALLSGTTTLLPPPPPPPPPTPPSNPPPTSPYAPTRPPPQPLSSDSSNEHHFSAASSSSSSASADPSSSSSIDRRRPRDGEREKKRREGERMVQVIRSHWPVRIGRGKEGREGGEVLGTLVEWYAHLNVDVAGVGKRRGRVVEEGEEGEGEEMVVG